MPSVNDRWSLRSLLQVPALGSALLAVFIGAIDLTVIAAILPQMVQDTGVNTSDIDRYIWIVSGYLIAYIVAIPIIGRLSDVAGRRNAYLGCLVLFLAGSIVCAQAQDLTALIVGRSIQGFGGGGLLPITLALAVDRLPPARRLAGIGLVSAVDTLGWVIGPLYGAAIESIAPGESPWRWVFWLNIPIVLMIAAFIVRRMPVGDHAPHVPEPVDAALADPRRGAATRAASTDKVTVRGLRQFDIPGAVLLTGAIVAVNLALSAGGEIGSVTGSGLRALGGTPNPLARYTIVLLIAAGVLTLGLVLVQRVARHPILPVALFRQRSFRLAMIANAVVGVVLMVAMVDVPVAVNLIASPRWATPVSAGMLAAYTAGIMSATLLSDRFTERLGLLKTMIVGLLFAAAGYLLLYNLLGSGHLLRMVPGLLVAGIGIGLILPPLSGVVVADVVEHERGAAAAMMLVSRLLGMTTGMSALTALAVKRLQILTERVPPVVRGPEESTAQFFARQQQFLQDTAFPLSVQVLGETFLVAGILALIALLPAIPLARLVSRNNPQAMVHKQ